MTFPKPQYGNLLARITYVMVLGCLAIALNAKAQSDNANRRPVINFSSSVVRPEQVDFNLAEQKKIDIKTFFLMLKDSDRKKFVGNLDSLYDNGQVTDSIANFGGSNRAGYYMIIKAADSVKGYAFVMESTDHGVEGKSSPDKFLKIPIDRAQMLYCCKDTGQAHSPPHTASTLPEMRRLKELNNCQRIGICLIEL